MTHANFRHGEALTRTKEYEAWRSMRQRCNNPNSPSYPHYGAQGVTICKRWNIYENFLVDMGRCPKGMTLDRINGNKGYFPKNCRWATPREQTLNRKSTVFVSIGSEQMCFKDACRFLGLNYGGTYALVRHHGMLPQAAIENANIRPAEKVR